VLGNIISVAIVKVHRLMKNILQNFGNILAILFGSEFGRILWMFGRIHGAQSSHPARARIPH